MASSEELTVREEAGLLSDDVLQPVMSLQLAKQRLAEFQAFVKDYLCEGEDFGTIPGTPKPTLYKPGADKLCELYGLSDSYEIMDKVEDFGVGLFDYTIRCTLTRIRTQLPIATGLGSCNSYEGKYRWRESQRKCPQCDRESIIKGKDEYGGGWVCFKKKGGCGAKFPDGAPEIMEQVVGRIENDDIATLKNTILKMAKKRAKIDATLAATRSSGVFTQDVEDITPQEAEHQANGIVRPQPTKSAACTCGAPAGKKHLGNCPARDSQPAQTIEHDPRLAEDHELRVETTVLPPEQTPSPEMDKPEPEGPYVERFQKIFTIAAGANIHVKKDSQDDQLHKVLFEKWGIRSLKKIPVSLWPTIQEELGKNLAVKA